MICFTGNCQEMHRKAQSVHLPPLPLLFLLEACLARALVDQAPVDTQKGVERLQFFWRVRLLQPPLAVSDLHENNLLGPESTAFELMDALCCRGFKWKRLHSNKNSRKKLPPYYLGAEKIFYTGWNTSAPTSWLSCLWTVACKKQSRGPRARRCQASTKIPQNSSTPFPGGYRCASAE